MSLLNAVLELKEPVVAVELLNPFSLRDFENDKQIFVDLKAKDRLNRVFVVEVQIVVQASFARRAVYYACRAYNDQLQSGQGYAELKATYSVCLLMRDLWDDDQLHHQFQLVERTSGKVLDETIEIHTVELSKYNSKEEDVPRQQVLQQWCYWIKNSHLHTAEELRALLPGLALLHATDELKAIQEITEEKEMYDSREKAALDLESNLIDAREEGRQEGLRKGKLIGSIQSLQRILDNEFSSESRLLSKTESELQEELFLLQERACERNG
jgi:predicted transposase/invertase (TIGR01784 family)